MSHLGRNERQLAKASSCHRDAMTSQNAGNPCCLPWLLVRQNATSLCDEFPMLAALAPLMGITKESCAGQKSRDRTEVVAGGEP
jgi:hypothetical protein